MKKTITLLVIATLIVVFYSCRKNSGTSNVNNGTQAVTLQLPATTDQYFDGSAGFMGTDSLNKVATLGRVLFYDTHLSANNAISCGGCHQQVYGFANNVQFSTGFQGVLTRRNAPGISELSQSATLFWDGRENNLQNLILRPITNHVEMGIDDASVLPAKLAALPYYSQLFKNAFGDDNITTDRISQAVALFTEAIGPSSNKSRLDLYTEGQTSILTAQEIQGKTLFDIKYNCQGCHSSNFGGYSGPPQSFKDIGLDKNYTDIGRGEVTGNPADNGTFKVPNLRNVALTAPYMHDGRYKTLEECVDHYSHNIMPSTNLDPLLQDGAGNPKQFNVSDEDKAAIVAFLKTLTDYTTVTDPKFSNPFKVNN